MFAQAAHLGFVGWVVDEVSRILHTKCHEVCFPKKKRKKKGKPRQNNENNGCKKLLGADECPFDVACLFLLPNHAGTSAAGCIRKKEGVCFPEGLALPLQPCFVSLCARREPTTAGDLLSGDTAFWKPGLFPTARMRGSKLREDAVVTGAVLCRGKERGLKTRRRMSLPSC